MTVVKVSCPVYPSEVEEKVSAAIMKIFPDIILESTDKGLEGTYDNLNTFSNMIRKQKILDSTRSIMLRGSSPDKTVFFINKQVATTGKISFTEEKTVLGSIRVIVEDDNIEALIETVAPKTVDGEEVRI